MQAVVLYMLQVTLRMHTGKGGKNKKKGKNQALEVRRDLITKEDLQGRHSHFSTFASRLLNRNVVPSKPRIIIGIIILNSLDSAL